MTWTPQDEAALKATLGERTAAQYRLKCLTDQFNVSGGARRDALAKTESAIVTQIEELPLQSGVFTTRVAEAILLGHLGFADPGPDAPKDELTLNGMSWEPYFKYHGFKKGSTQ